MIVGLADLKAHFGLDANSSSRDADVAVAGEAAEIRVSQWIGRPIYSSLDNMPAPGDPAYDPGQIVADAAIIVAVKIIARRLYDFPFGDGADSEQAVPPASIRDLLSDYRRFWVEP